MTKKLILIALCLTLFAVGVVTFSGSKARSKPQPQSANQPPTHVVYWHLFRHVVFLNKKAEEVERKGEDGAKYRLRYKNLAQLNDQQSQLLNQIAADCYEQVRRQDEKAKRVIDAVRAQAPSGQLQPGQAPPPLPAELKPLQEERDRIILEAQKKLREGLGEQEFERFDRFVAKNLGSSISTISPDSVRPAGARHPATLPRSLQQGAPKQSNHP